MTTINISNARKSLFDLADNCIKYNDVVNINTKSGNVVMLSADDYSGMMETLYLNSIPGVKESILEERNTPLDELEELVW